jgi:four helix bundle protein
MDRKYDLEDRLIDFGVRMIILSKSLDFRCKAGHHLSGQLVRSGTSPGLHYGEAQGAESKKDFIHKMKIVLKELNETRANLKMIDRAKLSRTPHEIQRAISECTELIKIFEKSIQTARKR